MDSWEEGFWKKVVNQSIIRTHTECLRFWTLPMGCSFYQKVIGGGNSRPLESLLVPPLAPGPLKICGPKKIRSQKDQRERSYALPAWGSSSRTKRLCLLVNVFPLAGTIFSPTPLLLKWVRMKFMESSTAPHTCLIQIPKGHPTRFMVYIVVIFSTKREMNALHVTKRKNMLQALMNQHR